MMEEYEYIEKIAAVTIPVLPKEHRKYQTMNLDDAYEKGWYDALECVEKIPPTDVRSVVRGKWEPKMHTMISGELTHVKDEWYGDVYICDQCGFEMVGTENFCPYCGADMREDKT